MISISGANEVWTEQGYNDWRRQVFDDLPLDGINEMVRQDAADSPFE